MLRAPSLPHDPSLFYSLSSATLTRRVFDIVLAANTVIWAVLKHSTTAARACGLGLAQKHMSLLKNRPTTKVGLAAITRFQCF